MKWVTRERPKIDRIACPWLISRFIDRAAEFLFVPGDAVLATAGRSGATPFDVPGAELNIGKTVPETVEIHKIEAPDVEYSYTVVGGRTYVVEPGTRKIIHVLD